MKQRINWLRILLVAACLFCHAGLCVAAPRLYLDSQPLMDRPSDVRFEMIWRELPRQALLIYAANELHQISVDATIEPNAVAAPEDVSLKLAASLNARAFNIQLQDASGKALETAVLKPEELPSTAVIASYAELAEELVRTKWEATLARQLKAVKSPPKWDPALPAPPDCARLLLSIDFQSAFLAAHLTHQAIAETGESPARLGVLVRAYAHLGESTRHLINGQSSAFFARSLIYAQRLLRLAPDDANSWWHRAYAQALYGFHKHAAADLAKGNALAAGRAGPTWVQLTDKLLKFNTNAMYIGLDKETAPLATYFAWLAIMDSRLTSVNVRFARQALEQNLGAVRIHDALTTYGGISLRGATTAEASKMLNRLMATLANEPTAPQALQTAAARAVELQFTPAAIGQLLGVIDGQPAEPSQLLPWSVYSAIVRDAQFINCIQRLELLRYSLASNPGREPSQWMALLSTHRYADLIAAFDVNASPAVLERARQVKLNDDGLPAMVLDRHMARGLGVEKDPRTNRDWSNRHAGHADRHAYYYTEMIRRYAVSDDNAEHNEHRAALATKLEEISPDHPLIITGWLANPAENLNRIMERISPEQRREPAVKLALGQALTREGRHDEAIPLLESVVALAPDRVPAESLAKAYLAAGNEAAWLKTLEDFIQNGEDYGLDDALVNESIAQRYLATDSHQRALPYAAAAARSFSARGLNIYVAALTRAGEFDTAAEVNHARAQRYNLWGVAYRWCRTTGRGDLATMTRMHRGQVDASVGRNQINELLDAAHFFFLEGDVPKAVALATRVNAAKAADPFYRLALGMLLLESGDSAAAARMLEEGKRLGGNSTRTLGYAQCAAQIARCIADPKALPDRHAEIEALLKDPTTTAPAGNVAYYLGRICEMHGQREQARQWYRTALDVRSDDCIGRPLAAAGLRRLGDEYFK